MEWISVETRLPEEKGRYLCSHKDWHMEIIFFQDGYFDPIGLSTDVPTHWMPMPEPPK